METVPAMVPAARSTGDPKTALVVFAGIVNLTDLPPVENCTAGSSAGTIDVEVKARSSVP